MLFKYKRWESALSNSYTFGMSTIKPFFDLGIDFSNSDDRDYFWMSFQKSIMLHDNELFHFILERRDNDNTVSDVNRKVYESNVFIFALKVAFLSCNFYVIKYVLEAQPKSEITKSEIWREETILNHALYVLSVYDNSVLTGEKPWQMTSLIDAYARKIGVERPTNQDWDDMKRIWLHEERIKILLYIINYDPQVNMPMNAKSYGISQPYPREDPYPIFPLHQELMNGNYFHFGENTQILTELLNRGANPNVQTSHGFTPLHYCNSKKEVELLLSVGANPELKNKWGTTARESADGLKAIQPFNIPSPFDDI